MDLIPSIIQFYLFNLALGMSLFSLIVRTELTGVGFYKVVLGVMSGSLVIMSIIRGSLIAIPSLSHYIILAILFLAVVQFKIHKDKRSSLMWILFVLQNLLLLYLGTILFSEIKNYLFALTSMVLMGAVTYTMVLGHWYLVTPRLTEKPLARGIIFVWAALIVKVILSTYGYIESESYFTEHTMLGAGYSFNWMLLSMRVLWGYLIIAILSYFTWKLINMRSLQSATGVLYVMTFFIFIGELISSYLFYSYGMII